MKNKRHPLLFIPIFAFFIFSGCAQNTVTSPSELTSAKSSFSDGDKINVTIHGVHWCSEVAKSEKAKAQGLSGRDPLTKNTAMIFPFVDATYQTFWMKDMKFNLDLVWIKDNQVVDISRNVPHPTSPVDDKELPRYTPKTPVNIVLEVNANEARSLVLGDAVTYNTPCVETPSS